MTRLLSLLLICLIAATSLVTASSWLFGSDKVYNAWHKTELERWLDDYDIPYPAAADRKDLADTVSKNWAKVTTPVYEKWDEARLRSWLAARSLEFQADAKKEALIDQVKSNWYSAKANAESSWETVRDWIFDSWSESTLKAFLDRHGIPCPQPPSRDTLLDRARENYNNIRKAVGDTAAVPGNWLFEVWSDSDLKAWCDARGIPVPQGSKRNELIALVRRNMRKAQFQGRTAHLPSWASVPSKGDSSISDAITRATDSVSTAASKYGKKPAESALHKKDEAFEEAMRLWSASRLKAYLDERGVPVPQHGKIDELRAAVRENAYRAKVNAGFTDATFDTWSTEELRRFVGTNVKGTRDELIAQAKRKYASASAKGGEAWRSLTSQGAKVTAHGFEKWSDSDLKSFLDSYGVPVPQKSERNDLVAEAKKHSRYFSQGPDWYNHSWANQAKGYFNQGVDYIKGIFGGAPAHPDKARDKVQQAHERVKEEL